MKKSATQLLARIGVILQILLGSSFAFGQVVGETKTIEITVDDTRPLAAAILKIEELSGIPINYEDVPVYYSGDMHDVTDLARTPPPPGIRILASLMRHFSVSIVVDATTGRLNDIQAVNTALSALVSAYNSSNLPGDFEIEQSNGVFFVKPVSYRDASGATQPMTPVLSTPITLPEEKRGLLQPIDLILQQVSKSVGSHVGLGMAPLNGPREIVFGANNEPAYHAIARYVTAMVCPSSRSDLCQPAIAQNSWDVGFHYRLSYGPGWGYGFSVDRVPNSRWWVRPPSKPYSPPPRRYSDDPTAGPGAGPPASRRAR